MTFGIVLIAMVAGFLALRLYSVLGRRTGHEQEPVMRPVEDRRPAGHSPRPMAGPRAEVTTAPALGGLPRDVQRGLQAIAAADRGFDATQFLTGAGRAYRMVLEAFWSGDRNALDQLCDVHVLADFTAAIEAREERGERLENRLVRIDDINILEAEVDGNTARITVRFDADVAALTRDRDGQMIGGSMTDAIQTHDLWTFARDVRARDPEWRLVETDVA